MSKYTMQKYVVKNCPCNVTTEDMCDWENTNETYCEDCTDCLIKQVIEKCKEAKINFEKVALSMKATQSEYTGTICKAELAHEIIQLFDISELFEVEE